MGNNQPADSPLLQFQPLPPSECPLQWPSSPAPTIIKHQRTGQLLMLKQLVPQDRAHGEQIRDILQAKMQTKCSYVTEVVYWRGIGAAELCGTRTKGFLVAFNNVGVDLGVGMGRVGTDGRPQVEGLSAILEGVLKGLRYYQSVNHLHSKLDRNSLFFDGRRTILLDPWLTEQCPPSQQQNLINIYKSPEKQLFENNQILSYDKFRSLLYELGLMLLDLGLAGRYGQAYRDRGRGTAKRVNIGAWLDQVDDFKFRSKLSVLLNPNPEKRLLIFNILLPDKVILKQFNPRPRAAQLQIRTDHTNKSQPRSLKKSKNRSDFQTCSPSPSHRKGNKSSDKYFSYQASPESRSVERLNTVPANENRNPKLHSQESSFTYAEMLRTPTQTSNYFQSKRTSPFGHTRALHTLNWPNAHKLLHLNTNLSRKESREKEREREVSPFELRVNGDRYNRENSSEKGSVKNRYNFKIGSGDSGKLPTISSVSNLHQNSSFSYGSNRRQSRDAKSPEDPIRGLSNVNGNFMPSMQYPSPEYHRPIHYNFSYLHPSVPNPAPQLPSPRPFVPPLPSISINNRPLEVSKGPEPNGEKETAAQSPTNQAAEQKSKNRLGYGFSFSQSSVKESPPTPSFSRLDHLKPSLAMMSHMDPNDVRMKKKTTQSIEQLQEQFNLPQQEQSPQLSYIKIEQEHSGPEDKNMREQAAGQSQTQDSSMADRIIIDRKEIEAKETESIIFDGEMKKNVESDVKKYSAFGNPGKAVRMQSNPVDGRFRNFADFITSDHEQDNLHQLQGITKYTSQHHGGRVKPIHEIKTGIIANKNTPATNHNNRPGLQSEGSARSNSYGLKYQGQLVTSIEEKTVSSVESVLDQRHRALFGGGRAIGGLVHQDSQLQQVKFRVEQQVQSLSLLHPSNDTLIHTLSPTVPNLESNVDLHTYTIEYYPSPSTQSQSQIQQRYEGYKKNNMKNGRGVYYYANGYVYEGDWKDDREHGQGRLLKHRDTEGKGSNRNVIQNRDDFQLICEGVWSEGQFLRAARPAGKQSQGLSSNRLLSDKLNPSITNFLPPSARTITSFPNSSNPSSGSAVPSSTSLPNK